MHFVRKRRTLLVINGRIAGIYNSINSKFHHFLLDEEDHPIEKTLELFVEKLNLDEKIKLRRQDNTFTLETSVGIISGTVITSEISTYEQID